MRNRNGFTLIELLVVITIIAVLAGLLIPGVMRAMQQAKANRALSEMQHLATVITQVYSEVGYYVTLESLVQTTSAADVNLVRRWVVSWDNGVTANDYRNGWDDSTITNNLSLPTPPLAPDVSTMWNGPYTTYKNYYNIALQNYPGSALPIPPNVWDSGGITQITNAPLDPWGRPYRMFWIDKNTAPIATRLLVPAGATGTMVIISAGGDGILQSLVGAGKQQRPTRALQTDFNAFDPSNVAVTEKDVYYIFNAGIQ